MSVKYLNTGYILTFHGYLAKTNYNGLLTENAINKIFLFYANIAKTYIMF